MYVFLAEKYIPQILQSINIHRQLHANVQIKYLACFFFNKRLILIPMKILKKQTPTAKIGTNIYKCRYNKPIHFIPRIV